MSSTFPDGIYLEEEEAGALGVVVSNYFAARQVGGAVEVFLLDGDMALTGHRERVDVAEFGERFRYQPRHQSRYEALAPSLPPLAAGGPGAVQEPAAPPTPGPQAAPEEAAPPAPEPGQQDGADAASQPPAPARAKPRPAKQAEPHDQAEGLRALAARQAEAAPKDDRWWERARQGARSLFNS